MYDATSGAVITTCGAERKCQDLSRAREIAARDTPPSDVVNRLSGVSMGGFGPTVDSMGDFSESPRSKRRSVEARRISSSTIAQEDWQSTTNTPTGSPVVTARHQDPTEVKPPLPDSEKVQQSALQTIRMFAQRKRAKK